MVQPFPGCSAGPQPPQTRRYIYRYTPKGGIRFAYIYLICPSLPSPRNAPSSVSIHIEWINSRSRMGMSSARISTLDTPLHPLLPPGPVAARAAHKAQHHRRVELLHPLLPGLPEIPFHHLFFHPLLFQQPRLVFRPNPFLPGQLLVFPCLLHFRLLGPLSMPRCCLLGCVPVAIVHRH